MESKFEKFKFKFSISKSHFENSAINKLRYRKFYSIIHFVSCLKYSDLLAMQWSKPKNPNFETFI